MGSASARARSTTRRKFDTPYIRDFLLDRGALADVSETSAAWSQLVPLYDQTVERASKAFEQLGVKGWIRCHLSHSYHSGSCLYFTFAFKQSEGDPIARYDVVKAAVQQSLARNQPRTCPEPRSSARPAPSTCGRPSCAGRRGDTPSDVILERVHDVKRPSGALPGVRRSPAGTARECSGRRRFFSCLHKHRMMKWPPHVTTSHRPAKRPTRRANRSRVTIYNCSSRLAWSFDPKDTTCKFAAAPFSTCADSCNRWRPGEPGKVDDGWVAGALVG
ncbi:FAD-linked oxidase C-terminal domain-containing protein [Kribbella solani]|uniref:FAD-linked oxidase C-terminal domain-containing protein n=1 Tax=Kribbella solani TaxID=236067 RepID=UPI0029ADF785|nr:FAD-linked oxidase C-terminal domain-containing protein [Kribbella solani]MDX2968600.1 FAD-linked oxidase C-terminal domain-containing protein [Kribbella solani]